MRLITAVFCAPVIVVLALTGCGGGDGVTPGNTSAETSASSPTTSTGSGLSTGGSARLSWVAPTQNSDGSPLTNLAGYIIYYGTDTSALTQTIQVSDPSALNYVVSGLATGTTWYFAVTSYTASGEESARSALSSKTI